MRAAFRVRRFARGGSCGVRGLHLRGRTSVCIHTGTGSAMAATEGLNAQEKKSLTHGEFWIPEGEREVYREALDALNGAGLPYVLSGLYAVHSYTGVYRETKDLDLLVTPDVVVPTAEVLKAAGFEVVLKEDHWLAQAFRNDVQVDFIFGMANGMAFIDDAWYEHSRPAILAAATVRIAPAEELIWHRLFIGERHRFDMADVVHLILHRGPDLDWDRLLERIGPDWRLLASQLHFFDFTYPDHRDRIPSTVRERMRQLALDEAGDAGAAEAAGAAGADTVPITRGTLLSRYSFAIDVNEWGFRDERLRRVSEQKARPEVERIRSADVWVD
jgi:hypothetical protein